MPELSRIRMTRVVAQKLALDAVQWPEGTLVLRVAPDEVFVAVAMRPEIAGDPHAIVESDDSFVGAWVPAEEALRFLESACEWEPPVARPSFAQGSVAGLPVKLWFEQDRILFLVPAPYAVDLEERMA